MGNRKEELEKWIRKIKELEGKKPRNLDEIFDKKGDWFKLDAQIFKIEIKMGEVKEMKAELKGIEGTEKEFLGWLKEITDLRHINYPKIIISEIRNKIKELKEK